MATASHDCLIRVFNISQKDGGLPLVFKGHTSKPFNVEWNPILFNYFASGSDDTTIRVWNIQNLNDFKELVGHTNNVRGLLWNTEIPWLLLSGSWDSTIRLWDVRTKNCIFVCKDHNADVYGIAVHEDRPFTYVSCSRDTSLRFWNLEDMFNEIFLRVLENQYDCFGEEIEVFPVEKEIVRLFGSSGRKMKKDLKVLWEGEDMIGYYERILNFFKVR